MTPQGPRRRPDAPTTPLRQRREDLGLTQAQLGDQIGIKVRYLRDIETGRRPAPPWYALGLEALEGREDTPTIDDAAPPGAAEPSRPVPQSGLAAQLALLHAPTAPTALDGPARTFRSLYGEARFALGRHADMCSTVLGSLGEGEMLHVVSLGDWSMDHAIAHYVDQRGPAHLRFSTWSINTENAHRLVTAREAGLLLSVRGAVDWRLRVRKPEALEVLAHSFGRENLRVTNTHAKVYLLDHGDRWTTILSSANLTTNPRAEASVIVDGRDAHDFHLTWIEALLDAADPFDAPKTRRSR